jgi:sugar fermentation stimulation protein A
MKFDAPLLPGRLIRRYKRFLADVRLDDDTVVTAHCPNPGTMKGCHRPGGRVLLSESDNPKRKLAYTWELARMGRIWVGVNTLRTNRVVGEALARRRIPEVADYPEIRAEVAMGDRRRVDFLLRDEDRLCYLEVKNVSLAVDGVARFPDAVTARGTAHLLELSERVREGHRAVMLYMVNRGDCDRAGPARDIDPVYAENLEAAVAVGVTTLAYRARVGKNGITLADRIPFEVG